MYVGCNNHVITIRRDVKASAETDCEIYAIEASINIKVSSSVNHMNYE